MIFLSAYKPKVNFFLLDTQVLSLYLVISFTIALIFNYLDVNLQPELVSIYNTD